MSLKWGNCYVDHFPKFFGEAIADEIFRRDAFSKSIQILHFDCEQQKIFCSLGLSHYSRELGRVSEVCCSTNEGWEYVPYLIANSLLQMVNQGMKIGWGMSIQGVSNICPPFFSKYDKGAIYFTHPYGFSEDFWTIPCECEVGYMYQAYFISLSEHKYFVENGAHKFEELVEENEVDMYDLTRSSCV